MSPESESGCRQLRPGRRAGPDPGSGIGKPCPGRFKHCGARRRTPPSRALRRLTRVAPTTSPPIKTIIRARTIPATALSRWHTQIKPPPPLPDYEQPQAPGDGYLWTPGYWAWGRRWLLLGSRRMGAGSLPGRSLDPRLLGLPQSPLRVLPWLLGAAHRLLRRR